MKKILLGSLFLAMTGCIDMSQYNYRIRSNDGVEYYVKSYQKNDDGCIKFESMAPCRCKDVADQVTICGNYTIIKLNKK